MAPVLLLLLLLLPLLFLLPLPSSGAPTMKSSTPSSLRSPAAATQLPKRAPSLSPKTMDAAELRKTSSKSDVEEEEEEEEEEEAVEESIWRKICTQPTSRLFPDFFRF